MSVPSSSTASLTDGDRPDPHIGMERAKRVGHHQRVTDDDPVPLVGPTPIHFCDHISGPMPEGSPMVTARGASCAVMDRSLLKRRFRQQVAAGIKQCRG